MNEIASLKIRMNSRSRTAWNTLLQKGFYLEGTQGVSVREFMTVTVGYDDCMIEEVVRTVFLNNSPVDNIDEALIKDGDRMALGSAMPGLVGICMGRDNPYKSFRSGIASHGDGDADVTKEPAKVFIKVFSNLAVDTGADLLGRGIEVEAVKVADLFAYQAENIVDDGGFNKLQGGPEERIRIVVDFE